MGMAAGFEAWFAEHEALARRTREALAGPFARLLGLVSGSLLAGGKLLAFGNGGSAADAQHLVAELVVKLDADRSPFAAIALAANSSTVTAAGNDYGFDQVFARQIRALGRPGDVALGLSTSGRSRNVIEGLRAAKDMGLAAAALSGGDGGDLRGLADPLLLVPSTRTSAIQEMHIVIAHILAAGIEEAWARKR
jgi:D-sedoheptulose 7-phosphate isomerase